MSIKESDIRIISVKQFSGSYECPKCKSKRVLGYKYAKGAKASLKCLNCSHKFKLIKKKIKKAT